MWILKCKQTDGSSREKKIKFPIKSHFLGVRNKVNHSRRQKKSLFSYTQFRFLLEFLLPFQTFYVFSLRTHLSFDIFIVICKFSKTPCLLYPRACQRLGHLLSFQTLFFSFFYWQDSSQRFQQSRWIASIPAECSSSRQEKKKSNTLGEKQDFPGIKSLKKRTRTPRLQIQHVRPTFFSPQVKLVFTNVLKNIHNRSFKNMMRSNLCS